MASPYIEEAARRAAAVPSSHTPGPWAVQARLGGGYAVIAPCQHGAAPPRDIAPHDVANDLTKANAHLIAAAPDMLAALQALFQHCSMIHNAWGDGCNQKESDAAITAGRAAIAKATQP